MNGETRAVEIAAEIKDEDGLSYACRFRTWRFVGEAAWRGSTDTWMPIGALLEMLDGELRLPLHHPEP